MLDNKVIYQGVLDFLANEKDYPDLTVNLWFRSMSVYSLTGGDVTLLCENNFKRSTVLKKYMEPLTEAFSQELEREDIRIFLITKEELENKERENETQDNEPPKKEEEDSFMVNPTYTFKNFVVGSSNNVAYETSLMICRNPATFYNPLFLYGPSGLGKTHLLFAIINEIQSIRPDFKVVYITCEEFTNLLIDSISKKRDPFEFRGKFRNLDFLLVDDIQFIANKKAVQEEMFHTFETLYNRGKQIVFASDRQPSEIENIDKRLTSRFGSGGLIDIHPPDLELRQAIFQAKAESYGVDIPISVLFYLADNIRTNIRQIEGAIKTLKAYSLIGGEEISFAMAKRVLSDFLKKAESNSINAENILKFAALKYNLKKEDISGGKRDTNIKNARHICAFLMRNMLNMTFKEIGSVLNKHYSTIMDSCEKIDARMKTSEAFRKEIEDIEREITQS